jgi:hypothetical protein
MLITVTAQRYAAMLQNFLLPELEALGVDPNNLYHQQKEASARTATRSMGVVHIPWPARSPDLTVPDYFLRGYLKESVHRNRPQATKHLKHAIQNEIPLIKQDQNLLHKVPDNFVDRLRQCTVSQGGNLHDVIYHNEIAFCEHNLVFHSNVLQLLNKL